MIANTETSMSSPIMMLWLDLRVSTNILGMCLPARLVVNEATGATHLHEGPVRQNQHTGWDLPDTSAIEDVHSDSPIDAAGESIPCPTSRAAALQPFAVLVSAP